MKRKIVLLIISITAMLIPVPAVFAENLQGLRIYNADFVTNDIYSTFIEGEVSSATGQDILLNQGLKNIARITLPKTEKTYSFRIKVPSSCLKYNGETHLRVHEEGGSLPSSSLPVALTIKHRPRKSQTVQTSSDEYKLTFPGVRQNIKAQSLGNNFLYKSENPDVVTISDKGDLVPTGAGTAIVSITAIGNSQYESASKEISVSVDKTNGYLVSFHSSIDEEEDIVKEQLMPVGSSTTLESNTFENGDHEFLGWATEDGGMYAYSDEQSVKDIAENGGNKDLYAIWSGDGVSGALAWAFKIATDDSFCYGYKPMTSKVGCYFCGTTHRNKPKGYEKTYVCMTFVTAAYAHGAEDPEMLEMDKGGKYTLGTEDNNFKFKCWEKVGLTRNLSVSDLKPGDVICWYAADNSSGHLAIYAGDGDIVDAGRVGWGADSIAVRKGAAAKYLSSGTRMNSKSYVMRYVDPKDQ